MEHAKIPAKLWLEWEETCAPFRRALRRKENKEQETVELTDRQKAEYIEVMITKYATNTKERRINVIQMALVDLSRMEGKVEKSNETTT